MQNKKTISERLKAFNQKLSERVLKQKEPFFDTMGTRLHEKESSEEEEQAVEGRNRSLAKRVREMLSDSSKPHRRNLPNIINR